MLGALGAMAPHRKADLAAIVLRAMVAGNVACFMTACIAGKDCCCHSIKNSLQEIWSENERENNKQTDTHTEAILHIRHMYFYIYRLILSTIILGVAGIRYRQMIQLLIVSFKVFLVNVNNDMIVLGIRTLLLFFSIRHCTRTVTHFAAPKLRPSSEQSYGIIGTWKLGN